ncbi:RGS domain-containing protein [Xylogone sp. PMI_703]|nr:RGS domain-containing protein [Xylogone sp. PMI_703]
MGYLKNAMRKSKQRRPPSIYLPTSTKSLSPRSSVISDCDADDEGFMSGGDAQPSRPLSLTIPGGPYCPRRPTLREVLADESSPPWTLSAFMQYLSQNHCLETLEFTMDASRYSKHYQAMMDRDPHTPLSPTTPDCAYVRMLWQKLLDAYIAQNSPREVNLPSEVRDELMSLPNDHVPPHPSHLDQAVKIVYELMDESVLVPFLNSVAPSRGVSESYSNPWTSEDSMMDVDERSLSPSQSRERDQSPSGAGADGISRSQAGSPSRQSQHLSPPANRSSRLSANLSYTGSGSSSAVDAVESLTDDSGDSPMASAMEPMTPPTTPPQSDMGFSGFSPNGSPRNSRSEGTSGWKKVGAKLGWKRNKAHHAPTSSTSFSKYFTNTEPVDDSGNRTP